MKVILIHNPSSGDGESRSADTLTAMIRNAGHAVVYVSSQEKDWKQALEDPADIVAVAGGDGIVGKVAKQTVGLNRPIAVLPLGTANNIARTLGLVGEPLNRWVAAWGAARHLKVDVGVALGPWGTSYFIEGAGMGVFTEVMSRLDARGNIDLAHAIDAKEKISAVRELLVAEVAHYPAGRLDVFLDDEDISGEYLLLEAMNIRAIGPNLHLAPEADPTDGFLDIVSVSKDERERLMDHLIASLDGEFRLPDLTRRRGKHLRIVWKGFQVRIDDEVWPGKSPAPLMPEPIEITSGPASVVFLSPPV
jgi:diacylglycerol kinase family enzyme